jgi:hypothetical protein
MKGKNMKTNKFFTLLLVLALTAMLTSTALADEPTAVNLNPIGSRWNYQFGVRINWRMPDSA